MKEKAAALIHTALIDALSGGDEAGMGAEPGKGVQPTLPAREEKPEALCVTKFGKNMDRSQAFHVCSQLPAEKAKGSLPDVAFLKFKSWPKEEHGPDTEDSVFFEGVRVERN